MAEVLGADFGGEPLLDADHAQVQEHLEKVPDCRDTAGSLVLLWCGHGVQSGTKLWLQTRNDCGKINAADVIARCAESGVASCSTECVSLFRFVSFCPAPLAECPFTGPVELGRCAGFDLGRRVGEACRRVGLIFGL